MRALLLAAAFLPSGWSQVGAGPDGGTVWQGRIPNIVVPWDERPSAVYLPPGYDPTRRYPVVYLLHGMRGRPSSIWNGMPPPRAVRDARIMGGLLRAGVPRRPLRACELG
jgi:S-formylglutathione hydrolase FrmB